MSHRPDAETSTRQHTTLTRDKHPCPRRDLNPQIRSKRAAADPSLRPRGHRDRLLFTFLFYLFIYLMDMSVSYAHMHVY
jgi:hypothetical protein